MMVLGLLLNTLPFETLHINRIMSQLINHATEFVSHAQSQLVFLGVFFRFDYGILIDKVTELLFQNSCVPVDYLLLGIRQNIVKCRFGLFHFSLDPLLALDCKVFELLILIERDSSLDFVQEVFGMFLHDLSFSSNLMVMMRWLTSDDFLAADPRHFNLNVLN